MCSCPHPHSGESTTWAASVPADLTDIIAAAVGVQPVRAQGPLKLPMLQQLGSPNQAQVTTVQAAASAPANIDVFRTHCALGGCDNSNMPGQTSSDTLDNPASNCNSSPPLAPLRRPTTAEVQAAASTGNQHHTTSSDNTCSRSDLVSGEQDSGNWQGDASCQSAQQQGQPVGTSCGPQVDSGRPWTTVFDNMDDLQLPCGQLPTVLHDKAYITQLDRPVADSSGHQRAPSCDIPQAFSTSASQLEQQHQQLMCQLWSHMQLEGHCKDILLPPQPGHSNTSSCCSDDADIAVGWATDSSSLGSAGCDPLDSPSGSCISDSSRASSICSSRSSTGSGSEKRVTWGPVTEYQLPPEPQYSWLWQFVPDWKFHNTQGYKRQPTAVGKKQLGVASTAMGAAAASIVLAAGITAVVCFKRSVSV